MKVCRTCEREFKPSSGHRDCPACRGEKQKTPCVDCGVLSNKDHKRCIKCHNGSGSDSPAWKGGMVYHKKGYIMISASWHPRGGSNNGYVFEHILVMEDILGRYLVEGENVHHKNGVKDDNRPENLELWVRSQPSGIRASDALDWAWEIIRRYGSNSVSSEDESGRGGSTHRVHKKTNSGPN